MRFLNLSTRLSLRRCFAAAMVWLLLAAPAIASDILFKKEIGQYRIPAIVECKSGKLIAFSDHRYDGTDIGWGHHIDIVLKASSDGGKTWSQDELMVAKGGSRIAFFSYLSLSTSLNRSSPYRSHISPCDLSSDDCLLGLISLGRYGVEPR